MTKPHKQQKSGATDMNKGNNIFGQILKIIDRNVFHKLVAKYEDKNIHRHFG
jgi:hypothetical protein